MFNIVKHLTERNSLQDLNRNPRSFNNAATTELICTSKISLESNQIPRSLVEERLDKVWLSILSSNRPMSCLREYETEMHLSLFRTNLFLEHQSDNKSTFDLSSIKSRSQHSIGVLYSHACYVFSKITLSHRHVKGNQR
jgi:hypothetical protein